MSTELSSQTPEPKSVSLGAMAAIVIAIAAILLGLQNLYTHLHDRINYREQSTLLQKNITQLQNDFDHLKNNNVITQQRTLSTVRYLTHLANLNLTVDHNQTSALKILLMAQQELAESNNADFSALKQALSSDIAALRAAPDVDINQLFLTISTLNAQIYALSPIPTQPAISLEKTVNEMKSAGENLPWYRRALESLKQLKSLFIIRHLDQLNTPLLSTELEANIKQNIMSQLNMAQWALLHHDQKIYQSALQTVSQWLTRYFALSTAKDPIVAQLNTLEKTQINNALPNINNTLNALSMINHVAAPIENPIDKPIEKQIETPTETTIKSKKIKKLNPASVET